MDFEDILTKSIENEMGNLYNNKTSKENAERIINKCEKLISTYTKNESILYYDCLNGLEILIFVYKMWILDGSNIDISYLQLKEKLYNYFNLNIDRIFGEKVILNISKVVTNYMKLEENFTNDFLYEFIHFAKSKQMLDEYRLSESYNEYKLGLNILKTEVLSKGVLLGQNDWVYNKLEYFLNLSVVADKLIDIKLYFTELKK